MRNALALLCLLGLAGFVVPAAALATGPSAGDQQYIDPLSGSHHHSSSTTTSSPTTPAASTPSSSATTSGTAAASVTTTASAGTTAAPAAASSGKTLPFTGLNVGLAAGVGVLMLAAGAGMRRRVSRRA
jgi:cytoskeletal protein RodZ